MSVSVCVCMRACVRACVRVCVWFVCELGCECMLVCARALVSVRACVMRVCRVAESSLHPTATPHTTCTRTDTRPGRRFEAPPPSLLASGCHGDDVKTCVRACVCVCVCVRESAEVCGGGNGSACGRSDFQEGLTRTSVTLYVDK